MRPLALILLLLLLAVGTWKQLQPNPFPEPIPEQMHLFVGKSLHVCGYAVYALLAWVAFIHPRRRGMTLIVLILHALGTEIGQTYVVNRHGQPTDVLINWSGLYSSARSSDCCGVVDPL